MSVSTKKIEKDYLAFLKMVDGKHPKPHHHPAPLVHPGVWALLQLAASGTSSLSSNLK
jgi:hypothetical protein